MKLKAGILIIGSLLWDPDQSDKINYRRNWRRKNLFIKQRIHIKIPIRYGRLSGNRENRNYTMVFSKDCESKNELGKAYVVPLKNKFIRSLRGIEYQARILSKAEGCNDDKLCKGTNDKWCTIGLLFNPKMEAKTKNNILEYWQKILRNDGGLIDYNNYCVIGEESVLSECGEINLNWISSVKSNYQKRIDRFDFLFATCTKPKPQNSHPKLSELKEKALNDERKYFYNNFKRGITTFQDYDIK